MQNNVERDARVVALEPHHAGACMEIGRGLPAWFGIEEGLAAMATAVRTGPGWIAVEDGQPVGFVTVVQHFPTAWEIGWMAVAAGRHRRGIGRALVAAVIRAAHAQVVGFVQVKTLADTHPSPEYAGTRAFYRRMGFVPLEVFPDLWDPANPALLMVRSIEGT